MTVGLKTTPFFSPFSLQWHQTETLQTLIWCFFFYSLLGKFVSTVKDVFVSRKYHSRIPIISFVRCQIPIAICFNFSRVFLHLCMTHTDRWWSIKKGRERDGGPKRAEREHGWALLPERQNRDLGVNSLLGGLHINTFNMQVEIWVCRGK